MFISAKLCLLQRRIILNIQTRYLWKSIYNARVLYKFNWLKFPDILKDNRNKYAVKCLDIKALGHCLDYKYELITKYTCKFTTIF